VDFAIGLPQIAALLILIQRGAEEIHSARNTKALLTRGGREEGASYYPVVAVAHLGWIAGLFLLIPADVQPIWPLIWLYLALQVVRYWVIATLGPYWTHRIITLDDAPTVSSGAYGLVRHPNYAITVAETLLLPCAFRAVALGLIMTAIWMAVLSYKIRLEDVALAARRRKADAAPAQTSL
jgi:methyltransferase